ncbi:MAG: 3-ketoacyl-ACP reductase [Rhodospirillales bacterium]|jgi:NAD(P)-dependent dehydrogenase (short-subunit alcohol dehydrogenase family)|nr:3-ketoacyl-ACP reductase [Rhodospirillales bacterium]
MAASSSKGAGRTPVALVTGGQRGIGRGCVYALAEAGFDVVVNDLERSPDAAETLEGVAERGQRAAFVKANLADLDQHPRLVDEATSAFGSLDCLVNNAGVSVISRGDLLDVSVESFDRCIGVNLRGTFFLTQRIARWMVDHPAADGDPHRSIVTISSSNARLVSIARGEYCMSKAGLAMMTQLFGVRLAEEGIGVYEIRPGLIHTPMTVKSEEYYDRAIAEGISPIRRWGEPEDVGRTVATMATGGLPFTVGQAVCVDGGMYIRHY